MMKLLTLLVIVVGIIAVAQLAKVYRLSAELRGKRQEDISEADTRLQGSLWIVFMVLLFATTIWQIVRYGYCMPPVASEHGVEYDMLMKFNLYIILFVYFLVNALLFIFANKYRYDKNRKAYFFTHDNRLELVWTLIPALVLAVIIIYGLRTWIDMTGEAGEDAIKVELYSKQFDWTARYPGNDGEFGFTDFNTITSSNPLGIVTNEGIDEAMAKIDSKIASLRKELEFERGHLLTEKASLEEQMNPSSHGGHDSNGDNHAELHNDHADSHDEHGHDEHAHDEHAHDEHGHDEHAHDEHGHDEHGQNDHGHNEYGHDSHEMSAEQKAHIEHRIHEIEKMLRSGETTILTDGAIEVKEDKIYRLQRHKQRLIELEPFNFANDLSAWDAGKDDKIVKGEFHLPVGQEVEFVFRSRDVIHSAYMPHFRAQMNTVPGVPTRFKFTPTITTDEMRAQQGDATFDYILLCNKICGAAHFNMAIKIVIDTPEEYEAWLSKQKEFITDEEK